MRRFYLDRYEDASGVSGTGRVAEGVEFEHGEVVLFWLSDRRTMGTYGSIEDVIAIHGHEGRTRVSWIDELGGLSVSQATTIPPPPMVPNFSPR